MTIADLGWTRQKQEIEEGDYWFDGTLLVTKSVSDLLTQIEMMMLLTDAYSFAYDSKGIDYLIVYAHPVKGKLFFIDQVTRESLRAGDHPKEHHYATLMLASEY